MTAPCEFRQRLEASLVSDPSDEECEAIGTHLASCADCQAYLNALFPVDTPLSEVLAMSNPPEVKGYTYVKDGDKLKRLGKGGQSVVYLATRDKDRARVAVKFPLVHLDDSPLEQLRFIREVLVALELGEDEAGGIVRALHASAPQGRFCCVMEYVDGKNLFEFLTEGAGAAVPFPERARWAAEWCVHLADALQRVHDINVVHRDLKPSNVMVALDAKGRPTTMKITDFGLARRLRSVGEQSLGRMVGTPPYMAPEQLSGGRAFGPTVDTYGLGAVLYFMLTGQAPFLLSSDSPLEEVQHTILHEEPVPPRQLNPHVPYHLETIVLKCLRKLPSDRYPSAAELATDLRRFLAGKRPLAQRRTLVDRARTYARKHKKTVAVWTAILCLATLSTTFGILAWRGERHANAVSYLRLLDGARFALHRGQLRQALGEFDAVIESAPADQRPTLEVERLRCLTAFRSWERLRSELDRLGQRDDLPAPQQAQVLLFRGDVGLWEPAEEAQQAALNLIHLALAVPDGLGEADAAYARGLLTDSTPIALSEFDRALRADRFHLRANSALLMELVLCGAFDRAREQAAFMAGVFPDEPVVPLSLAVVATLTEDAAARRDSLAQLERLLGDPGRMTAFHALFHALDLFIAASHRAHGPEQQQGLLQFMHLLREAPGPDRIVAEALAGLRQGAVPLHEGDIPSTIGVGLPVLMRPQTMVRLMAQAHERLRARDFIAAAGLLESAARKHPEALIRLMQATAYSGLAQQLAGRNEMLECLRMSRRAHELAEQAAEAPTLIPFAPYRHNARWLCVMMEAGWSAQYRFDAAALALAFLPSAGSNPLAASATLYTGVTRLREYPARQDRRHLLRVAADSQGFDEARSDLLPTFLDYLDIDDARLLLCDWASDAPKDPVPYRLAARLELGRGGPAEALRWAERGLANIPGDPELQRLRERAKGAVGKDPAKRP